MMMEWEEADVAALAAELIATGLATLDPYNHLTLNPALCPYLRGGLDAAEREALAARWRRGDGSVCRVSSCSSKAKRSRSRRR